MSDQGSNDPGFDRRNFLKGAVVGGAAAAAGTVAVTPPAKHSPLPQHLRLLPRNPAMHS